MTIIGTAAVMAGVIAGQLLLAMVLDQFGPKKYFIKELKTMETSDVARKLKIKEGYRVCLLNAPEGYSGLLAPLPANVTVDNVLRGQYDFIHAFVQWKKDINQLIPEVKDHLSKGGLIWISYPKMSSKAETDLNRDILREAAESCGTKAVSMISINEVWSALRLKVI